MLGTAELDVAFLQEAGLLALPFDREGFLFRLQVPRPDLDHRVLLDVVAQLPAVLDILDEGGQTFGVEAVRGIEEFEARLVDVHDGDGLELQSVGRHVLEGGFLHAGDVGAALFVHLRHGHVGGDGAQRGLEAARQQVEQIFGIQGAAAERGGGAGDGLLGRLHPDVEFGLDVDAHAVAGDQCLLLGADDLQRHGVHVHRRDVVDDRPDEGAAVDDDLLAEETGSDESHFLGRAAIEAIHHPVDDGDRDDRDYEPKDDLANDLSSHGLSSRTGSGCVTAASCRYPSIPPISLNRRVCSVSATSVGRRSIEEAP